MAAFGTDRTGSPSALSLVKRAGQGNGTLTVVLKWLQEGLLAARPADNTGRGGDRLHPMRTWPSTAQGRSRQSIALERHLQHGVGRSGYDAPRERAMRAPHEHTRRRFLGQALALGVLPSLARTGRAAPRDKGPRLAVRGPFPQKDLRARAELLSRLGYQGIELGPEYLDQTADQIRKHLAGTGVSVSAIVGSLKLLDPEPEARAAAVELDRQRLELARQLGAVGVIEVPVFGPCRFGQGTDPGLEDGILAKGLEQLAADVRRTGVKILLEPLTRKETHYMNLQAHGARIIKAVGEPGVALLSDFYHMQMEEDDIRRTLKQFGQHTAYVHLADGEKRTEPGSLPFDYRPGFGALKTHGYSGWLTVESGATDSPEPALARAREYLLAQWRDA